MPLAELQKQRIAKAAARIFRDPPPLSDTRSLRRCNPRDLALAPQSQHLHVEKTACQWSRRCV